MHASLRRGTPGQGTTHTGPWHGDSVLRRIASVPAWPRCIIARNSEPHGPSALDEEGRHSGRHLTAPCHRAGVDGGVPCRASW